MTVIAAYTDGTDTWIGSDTFTSYGSGGLIERGPKWSGAHGWMFGLTGSGRAADLIENNKDELFRALDKPSAFADRLAIVFDRAGMKPNVAVGCSVPDWGSSGLLACRGAVYDVDPCLSIRRVPVGAVFARGCGAIEAVASAWGYQRAMAEAVPDFVVAPERLLQMAIECAATLDHNIRGCWVTKL